MLVEIFRRLQVFGPLEDYRYVGLGSLWFSDFSLFHRMLGIRHMISFEEQVAAQKRFEDNNPLSIRIDFRNSSLALVDLDWQARQFIWLDYDSSIATSILADVKSIASQARSGTVLVVSVPCVRASVYDDEEAAPTGLSPDERFEEEFGAERLPDDFSEMDLIGWDFGKLSLYIIENEINSGIVPRNSSGINTTYFHRICSFEYEDNAKMTTICGVFFTEDERETFEACRFGEFDFLDDPSIPVHINVPILTLKEMRHLEKQLPSTDLADLDVGSMPTSDAAKFAKYYRYFPNFAVIET